MSVCVCVCVCVREREREREREISVMCSSSRSLILGADSVSNENPEHLIFCFKTNSAHKSVLYWTPITSLISVILYK